MSAVITLSNISMECMLRWSQCGVTRISILKKYGLYSLLNLRRTKQSPLVSAKSFQYLYRFLRAPFPRVLLINEETYSSLINDKPVFFIHCPSSSLRTIFKMRFADSRLIPTLAARFSTLRDGFSCIPLLKMTNVFFRSYMFCAS